MSNLITPLGKLLKRVVLFQWIDSNENSFQKLKGNISSNVCIQNFVIIKLVAPQADTSKVWLGAVLIQKDFKGRDKPVAFDSKSNSKRNQVQ